MHTPYFPALRPRLAALGRNTAHNVRQCTLAQLQEHLRDFLPAPLLSTADEGPNSRERIFSLRLTCECFVWQMLKPKTACREVVRQVQALFRLLGRGPVGEGDSAYIQARQRLPKERLQQALRATASAAERRVPAPTALQQRPVKVVDCSSVQLPDTAANQQRYPQSRSQKPGCGFPLLKLLGIFSLASGAMLQAVLAGCRPHDLRLLRQAWEEFKAGDIVLGDRAFGEYATLAALPAQRHADVVARLHQKRKVDFRKATKRLGKQDGLFVWTKSIQQSNILSAKQWEQLPGQLTVRVLRFSATIRGQRARRITLVTTLLDAQLYPAQELIALYLRRWRLELCFRDLKTTLGMEILRCQSPDMAEKELLAYLIAHNLIRCIMAEAVACHGGELERVSFKGTLDGVREYSAAMAQARNARMRRQLWDDLLLNVASDLVPHRPERCEPRAVKRRPKPYPLLNQPRHQFVEITHRNDYWKGRPRDYRRLN